MTLLPQVPKPNSMKQTFLFFNIQMLITLLLIKHVPHYSALTAHFPTVIKDPPIPEIPELNKPNHTVDDEAELQWTIIAEN